MQVQYCLQEQQQQQQQQQQHSIFSQASWGRLEMKPERNLVGFKSIRVAIFLCWFAKT